MSDELVDMVHEATDSYEPDTPTPRSDDPLDAFIERRAQEYSDKFDAASERAQRLDMPLPHSDDGELRWIDGLKCPACNFIGLFLTKDGDVTCSQFDCPNPDYVAALQAREKHIREEAQRTLLMQLTEHQDNTQDIERANPKYSTEVIPASVIYDRLAALTPKSTEHKEDV